MLCDSTKTLLRGILESLEDPDQADWDGRIESGNQCLYEMHQMTRPSYQAYKTVSLDKWPSHIPDSERLHRAMPHVKAMARAIRRSDRAAAVECVKAALAAMDGISPSLPSGGFTKPRTENKEVSIPVRHQTSPAGKHRRVAAGRTSSGRCRAASGK
jgi:hypothetical protein